LLGEKMSNNPGKGNRYSPEKIKAVEELLEDPKNNYRFIERHTGVERRTIYTIKKRLAQRSGQE
jgi:hypothetical protein